MSRPSKRIRPAVGSMRRRTTRPTVVLPHPDSPTRPSVSPRRTSNVTPSTALTQPTVRWRMPLDARFVEPAADLMAGLDLLEVGPALEADGQPVLDARATAGCEAGAGRQVDQVGHAARDDV